MTRIIISGGLNEESLGSLLHMLDEAKREAFGESVNTVDLTEQDYEIESSSIHSEDMKTVLKALGGYPEIV